MTNEKIKNVIAFAEHAAKEKGYDIDIRNKEKLVDEDGNEYFDAMWYGGTVIELRKDSVAVEISARGDVIADMITETGENVEVTDRYNLGEFGHTFRRYIHGDKELHNADMNGKINIVDNNWYEIDITAGGLLQSESVIDDDMYGILMTMPDIIKDVESVVHSWIMTDAAINANNAAKTEIFVFRDEESEETPDVIVKVELPANTGKNEFKDMIDDAISSYIDSVDQDDFVQMIIDVLNSFMVKYEICDPVVIRV